MGSSARSSNKNILTHLWLIDEVREGRSEFEPKEGKRIKRSKLKVNLDNTSNFLRPKAYHLIGFSFVR